MPQEETKFILDKPLGELTEDDIAQVTREDCRRYLKEKGMRRPSWNKSQAIQQVIMLKKLLEASPDSGASSRKKLRISCPDNSQSSNTAVLESVTKGTSGGDAENSASAEETTASRRKDPERPDSSGGFPGRNVAAIDESAQARATDSTNILVGQMTIFYCGKVNVYDDVPADKAKAILNVAASPVKFPEQEVDVTTISHHLPCISKAGSTMGHQNSAAVILPTPETVRMKDNAIVLGRETRMLHEETPAEGSSTRKASVLRYLEKRKDRFKSKRKGGMTVSSSLDMYFNHQMSRSSTCSPPQIRSPSTPARCSSADNDSVKSICLSASLTNQALLLFRFVDGTISTCHRGPWR
ncbi:protein TIFY 4B-like isoform X2 [Andrographis paniculata]|uniref:protein TIFY 4B-like isoform X2 n=1 Tax=Andrographis paniculata TaxID=175694 RepID=UPI0021E72A2D|nr:protein TIFY 4B-like isoform X2 [Andrographis paniculata]